MQRETEQKPTVGHHDNRGGREPRPQAGCPQHGEVEQGIGHASFGENKDRAECDAAGYARERPRGPPLRVPQHQRQHDEKHRRHGDKQADHIQPPYGARPVPRHQPRHQDHNDESNGHIDKEHRPPGCAEQVGGH
jgi:hypothetical protein